MNVSARRKLLMLPGPTNVSDRVMQAMMRPMVNHRSPEFVEVVNGITEKGRYLFQTKQNVVTISSSGTGGIEAVADALVRPGTAWSSRYSGNSASASPRLSRLPGGR